MPVKKIKSQAFSLKSWVRRPSDKRLEALQKEEEEEDLQAAKLLTEQTKQMATGSSIAAAQAETKAFLKEALGEVSLMFDKKFDIFDKKFDAFKQEVTQKLQTTQAETSKIALEVRKMTSDMKQLQTETTKNELKIEAQKKEIEQMQRKLVYLEDAGRRNNIKILNFDVQKATQIKEEVLKWINSVLIEPITDQDLERVHFIGSPKAPSRPIIVKFANYTNKEKFLAEIRRKPGLLQKGTKTIQVYQDLSKSSVDWRISMREITSILVKNNLKYTWGHPIFLKIWKGNVQHRIHSVEEGRALLMAWNLISTDQSPIAPTLGASTSSS